LPPVGAWQIAIVQNNWYRLNGGLVDGVGEYYLPTGLFKDGFQLRAIFFRGEDCKYGQGAVGLRCLTALAEHDLNLGRLEPVDNHIDPAWYARIAR
jgi:hypothetical protein